MQVAFSQHSVETARWTSIVDLQECLGTCALGSMVLGDQIELPVDFHSAVFSFAPRGDRFGIGVWSETQALVPYLLLFPDCACVWLGFNREVVSVDMQNRRIIFSRSLDSLFYSFCHLPRQDLVLVIHEIGVRCFKSNGDELWDYAKDVVVDYAVDQNEQALRLFFMDSPSVTVDLLTGGSAQ